MSEIEDGLTIALDFQPTFFLPGHPVAGRLIVSSKEGVRTRGLSITFHGEIHNSWSEDSTHSSSHWYQAHEVLYDIPQIFLAGDRDHDLPPGNSAFPFSFHVPHNMPSSLHSYYGRVEYSLNAKLECSWAIDWTTNMAIPVMGLLDLQPYPLLNQPAEFYDEKKFGCFCCASDPMKLWCNLEKTGFYPGELIKFHVKIEDKSATEIQALRAVLNQNFTFRAENDYQRQAFKVNEVGRETTRTYSEEDSWEGELLVPVCSPTGLGAPSQGRVSHLISMAYTLDIIADVSGCFTVNPKVVCDITIGSLPPSKEVDQLPMFVPHEDPSSKTKSHVKKKNKRSLRSSKVDNDAHF